MRLSHFDHYAPKTVEEAIELLQSKGPSARLMAGGTDLLIKMRHGAIKPEAVISIKGIPGLNEIRFEEGKGLTIGATALLADVASHPDILKHFPAVAMAARGTANEQVRNLGTVVGNLCNASPAADNAPVLLAMGAEVRIQGPGGKREIPLDQFFKGPGITALEPTEIVTSIFAPLPPAHAGAAYLSLSARGKIDCTAIGAAAVVTMDGEICRDVRIFISSCGPTALRAPKAEDIVRSNALSEEILEKAGEQACTETSPITDVRASADYRAMMVAVLTRRVLKEARARALER